MDFWLVRRLVVALFIYLALYIIAASGIQSWLGTLQFK